MSFIDPHDLAALLPAPDRLALFLDVDGTLIGPTYADRERGIAADRIALIDRLYGLLGGALAIVSGRSVETVDPMFKPLKLPVAALQGADRRFADGRRFTPVQTPEERKALKKIATVVSETYPTMDIQWKIGALAIVYNEGDPLAEKAAVLAERYSGGHVAVIPGRVSIDVVPQGANKGSGIAFLMEHRPFLNRVPVHVGDDLPDAPGFDTAQDLGGYGIAIGGKVGGVAHRLTDHEETWTMLAAYEARWMTEERAAAQ
ncbi:trehalose-phosphatase [Pleomorphomonas oryzae]|uniref:trehalose-phosphatase n=1 Tax=Pleomorphomonas oryzae TaxID=261934 RepID=UPI0004041AD5|nr:trehalose-phosphatase [Pleomorphomonas oryzae]